jgi:hypothetical protein
MKALLKGQYSKHFQYGLGAVTESDEQRTSIEKKAAGMALPAGTAGPQ